MSAEGDKPEERRHAFKGRGAVTQRGGRFQQWQRTPEDDGWGALEADPARPATRVEVDAARQIITYNRSPDVPFDRSINPYRGCEHGCIYCYARPTHTYLDLSPGLDFETRLFYKPEAARLLEDALRKPGYAVQPIALGVNTDAYQPVERRLRVTRDILRVLLEYRHPVTLITKSALVERDLDVLTPMAEAGLVHAAVSVTTLDEDLNRRLEPRAAGGRRRLRTIAALSEAGVPTSVNVAPVIPFLTDHELETILGEARAAGARSAAYIMLRVPHEVEGLMRDWLDTHYPRKTEHLFSLLRSMHGGSTYSSEFGHRMRGGGEYAAVVAQRFRVARRRLGFEDSLPPLVCDRFRLPDRRGDQMRLF
ncbi:PA0069 family radical SAM protein [Ectothiorhodospiraceae bacterium WFHF3C12]|nr:PA0069 family radical SAM protein [Ectothiorhodospiraceae bacterium WFHF3C12]